jgi:hypothetical protein
MARLLTIAAILIYCASFAATSADAAVYCARFVGGAERATSHVHARCDYASLHACRAAVRARGGGHCYAAGSLR